jgi:type II secretory pathway component PulF
MTDQPTRGAENATLDDLAALNRELAALVAGGLPLESGLTQIADDFTGGAGRLAARLRDETHAGKSLSQAIAAQGDALPAVYRAVVSAGVRSNRLPAALEGYADAAARVADLRRIAAQAALYPLLVFIVAWIMGLIVLVQVLPKFDFLHIENRFWATPLRLSAAAAWTLAIAVPAAAIVLALVWWRRSAWASAAQSSWSFACCIPGARRTQRLSGEASFADLLHLLLQCRLPMEEALPLAADASGLPSLRRPAANLAAGLAAGQPLSQQLTDVRQLPPLVRAALFTSHSPAALIAALQRAAHTYRDRAAAWIGYVSVALPVMATLALGGVVVAVYSLLVIQPYIVTLKEMASW